MNVRTTSCCGLGELSGISYGRGSRVPAPISVLKKFCGEIAMSEGFGRSMSLRPKAFYVFTGVTSHDSVYGQRLADYILKNKLGTIVTSVSKRNPNSGNMIQIWTWGVDKEALIKWWHKREARKSRAIQP